MKCCAFPPGPRSAAEVEMPTERINIKSSEREQMCMRGNDANEINVNAIIKPSAWWSPVESTSWYYYCYWDWSDDSDQIHWGRFYLCSNHQWMGVDNTISMSTSSPHTHRLPIRAGRRITCGFCRAIISSVKSLANTRRITLIDGPISDNFVRFRYQRYVIGRRDLFADR